MFFGLDRVSLIGPCFIENDVKTALRRILQAAFSVLLLVTAHAHALTAAEALAIASGDADARVEALNKAVATADDKTAAFIQAMVDDAVKFTDDKVFVMKDGKG